MRLFILSFVGGTLWLQQQAALPDSAHIVQWALLGMALVVLCIHLTPNPSKAFSWTGWVGLAVAGGVLGFAWAAWMAQTRLTDVLPPEWEGRDVEVLGAVTELPQRHDRGVRFLFRVEKAITPDAAVPSRLSLTWYHETDRKSGIVTPAPDLKPGERWQLTLRLKRPHGSANPHGFDYEAWALERNIRATGYIRFKGKNVRLPERSAATTDKLHETRANIRERFQKALGDAPYAGVLIALAVGDQNAIPPEQWKVFWRTGVGHLMSISGLHITMVASLLYAVAFFAWARVPWLVRRVPAQRAAALLGLIGATGYALLAGFSIPSQRTLFMLTVVALALAFGRASSPTRVLCWALLAVVLIDPWAGLAPGFWLSFGAIGLIFYVTTARTGQMGAVRGAVLTQVAVTLGMLPMLLALFQEVSLASPIANAIAIPVISLLVVPVTLATIIVPLDFLLGVAHWLLDWCMVFLDALAAAPSLMWESHAPAGWTVVLALAGGLWLLLPRGWPARWLGLTWMLPMFFVLPPRPSAGEAWVTVLDVGHGLSAVVQTQNHALVYDTGPRWTEDADAGSRVVVPHLRGEGIRFLDGLVVSHDDEDHVGGAVSILAAREVGWLSSSLPPTSRVPGSARISRRCEAGSSWTWDGVRFEFLYPVADDYAVARIKDNDLSCVLRIFAGGKSILLTADVEKRAEISLVERVGAGLKSDVMLIPHHGAQTSSLPAFLDAVAPSIAVLPAGYRNRFRHPHPDVMARYAERNISVLRTDLQGAIHLKLANGQVTSEVERDKRRRYWQDRPQASATAED